MDLEEATTRLTGSQYAFSESMLDDRPTTRTDQMKRKLGWHRRLANWIGYDIDKFNKQINVETHLRENLNRWNIDVVLDVGANVGQYGLMLRDVGYTGQIISFEPGRDAYQSLVETCAHDQNWDTHNFALGLESSTAELNISKSSVFSSLHNANTFGMDKYGDSIAATTTEHVKVRRLDEIIATILPEYSKRSIFLKMDTQGHDLAVFEGAGELRNTFRAIQSEISVTPIYEGIPDYLESIKLYREHGYEVSGLYVVNRHRATGHVIEFDCVMARLT